MTEAAIPIVLQGRADEAVAERVLGAVPVTHQAFTKLLALLDIRTSTEIPTACVTLGERSRLLLNPDFLAAHCRTDETLAMLVMHELFHILFGHTRLFEHVTVAQNIAFDAVINAQLCLLFPEPGYTALFRNSYLADVLPWALLRPPEGWGSGSEDWALTGEAGRVHRALYTDTSVTYGELFELLGGLPGVTGGAAGAVTGRLLGNHDDPDVGGDPEVLREIRDIVARWPMLQQRSGRDEGGEFTGEHVNVSDPGRAAVGVIRRALLPLLDCAAGDRGIPRAGVVNVDTCLPYRTQIDRRAEVRALLGQESLFFSAGTRVAGYDRKQQVHVYVDVSGSMGEELPLLYGALVPLIEYLHPKVHLFSTEISDVTPAALRKGEVSTGWGTNIACVTDHLVEHKVHRALLVTDGWVGEVPSAHATTLRRRGARINTVLTLQGAGDFAAALAGRVHRLPKLA